MRPPAAYRTAFGRGLQMLKDLKEFIGLLVFFGGGLYWAAGYVATKQQVEELRCLMQQQIDLFKSETEQSLLARQVLDVSLRLDNVNTRQTAGRGLNDADRREYHELELERESLRKRRSDAEEKRNTVLASLQKHECSSP